MNTLNRMTRIASAITLGLSALTLVACASAPAQDPTVVTARTQLDQLKANTDLANHAQVAISHAETAVQAAEAPQKDPETKAHLAYIAKDKVSVAYALANARTAEDQLKAISAQRQQIQLNARTSEANQAESRAASATQQTAIAQGQAVAAQQEAAAANLQTGFANQQASEANARSAALEKQLADLHAKKTDRGTVFTLGDVVFATGKADLKAGAMADFDRLVDALKQAPDRHITIEGHTDSVGSDELNMALSQRRADSVKNYLVGHGILADRIAAVGKGKNFPVTSNKTATGRQKNRRVEVIIENAPTAPNGASN